MSEEIINKLPTKEYDWLCHNLWSLGLKSYKEYLECPIWKDKKKMMLESYPNCQKCKSKKGLQVHHKTYRHLGSEPEKDLIVLCIKCHKEEHNLWQIYP